MTRQPRPKKCKSCRESFIPRNSFATACSPKCAMELTHKAAERSKAQERSQARARTRADKVALRTRSDWVKLAQTAFNAYIRARDADKPCICCGRFSTDNDLLTGSRWDAGHYRSTGSAPHLRYVEDNCHRQLVVCNRHGNGRAVDYRIGLIKRIGLARVEAIEADQADRKYTIEDLKQIEAKFKGLTKELVRREAA